MLGKGIKFRSYKDFLLIIDDVEAMKPDYASEAGRINDGKVIYDFECNHTVPNGCRIVVNSTVFMPKADKAPKVNPKPEPTVENAPVPCEIVPLRALAKSDDKTNEPAEDAPFDLHKAISALPKVEPGQPRTIAQNSEFHGIISAIAKALEHQPADIKAVIVKGKFGALVHTKLLNYEQMAGLIDYAKSVADYYGVEV